MKSLKNIILIYCINIISIGLLLPSTLSKGAMILILLSGILAISFYIYINIFPTKDNLPSRRLHILLGGCTLLRMFLVNLTATILIQGSIIIYLLFVKEELTNTNLSMLIFGIIGIVILESIIFWSGMLRVYFTSVQLGIKHRVLGAVCGWIPFLNIYYLNKIIKICDEEVDFELRKIELNELRVESQICETTYPLLMVHGVFFRDSRFFNYWGRVPAELTKNGASVYYGEQESAGTVEFCAKQLAEKIEAIVLETGCDKVNIIAHSKGGLDSRVAISKFGAAKYVASLTTINTPHYGSQTAEFLLQKMPSTLLNFIANRYNQTLKRFGDIDPNFIAAINDLTTTSCIARNETILDADGILYESVTSYCHKAASGQFPLNISHHLVKHFEGKNDGLVAIDSAKWGSNFTLIGPKGKRGISHGDIIDLNRSNIDSLDVREFYIKLVSDLKKRGY